MSAYDLMLEMEASKYGSPDALWQDLAGGPLPEVPGNAGNDAIWTAFEKQGLAERPSSLIDKMIAAGEEENRRKKAELDTYRLGAKGRAATYLTGPQGLLDNPNLFKRSLLGT